MARDHVATNTNSNSFRADRRAFNPVNYPSRNQPRYDLAGREGARNHSSNSIDWRPPWIAHAACRDKRLDNTLFVEASGCHEPSPSRLAF
jgi:hypothetical protein